VLIMAYEHELNQVDSMESLDSEGEVASSTPTSTLNTQPSTFNVRLSTLPHHHPQRSDTGTNVAPLCSCPQTRPRVPSTLPVTSLMFGSYNAWARSSRKVRPVWEIKSLATALYSGMCAGKHPPVKLPGLAVDACKAWTMSAPITEPESDAHAINSKPQNTTATESGKTCTLNAMRFVDDQERRPT
jgi:hypothetical protein